MFRSSSVAGCWLELVNRLDSTGVVAGWSAAESELAGLATLGELPGRVAPGGDRDRVDGVLGALVRLAAVDGGNDPDAVLVLLHLLSDGACALAARLSDLAGDMLLLVVGQLTVQIRTFPWRRRTHAYAANLLLDTKAALWRELRPGRVRGVEHRELLVDPLDHRQVTRFLDAALPVAEEEGLRLRDVLVWAARNASGDLGSLGRRSRHRLRLPLHTGTGTTRAQGEGLRRRDGSNASLPGLPAPVWRRSVSDATARDQFSKEQSLGGRAVRFHLVWLKIDSPVVGEAFEQLWTVVHCARLFNRDLARSSPTQSNRPGPGGRSPGIHQGPRRPRDRVVHPSDAK
jgi:hypothetical protein